ncbi:unnamed protein product [Bursaphelenchus okinawaensis]|uniref:Zasp-like motif domain-containing protein n=1 Tax=Bursaphelenchus okinawaensis TaxID=465554 RepID=A0A811K0W8_9BILA|nr:unnamed protein product [Bursaphelenchus okinawaensis]CAG9089525.1 unnamed protein product [Bursaphelenchus okinawaensis]
MSDVVINWRPNQGDSHRDFYVNRQRSPEKARRMEYETINVRLQRSNPAIPWGFSFGQSGSNVIVDNVEPNSMAEKAGLFAQDIVEEAFNKKVSLNDVNQKIQEALEVTLLLKRQIDERAYPYGLPLVGAFEKIEEFDKSGKLIKEYEKALPITDSYDTKFPTNQPSKGPTQATPAKTPPPTLPKPKTPTPQQQQPQQQQQLQQQKQPHQPYPYTQPEEQLTTSDYGTLPKAGAPQNIQKYVKTTTTLSGQPEFVNNTTVANLNPGGLTFNDTTEHSEASSNWDKNEGNVRRHFESSRSYTKTESCTTKPIELHDLNVPNGVNVHQANGCLANGSAGKAGGLSGPGFGGQGYGYQGSQVGKPAAYQTGQQNLPTGYSQQVAGLDLEPTTKTYVTQSQTNISRSSGPVIAQSAVGYSIEHQGQSVQRGQNAAPGQQKFAQPQQQGQQSFSQLQQQGQQQPQVPKNQPLSQVPAQQQALQQSDAPSQQPLTQQPPQVPPHQQLVQQPLAQQPYEIKQQLTQTRSAPIRSSSQANEQHQRVRSPPIHRTNSYDQKVIRSQADIIYPEEDVDFYSSYYENQQLSSSYNPEQQQYSSYSSSNVHGVRQAQPQSQGIHRTSSYQPNDSYDLRQYQPQIGQKVSQLPPQQSYGFGQQSQGQASQVQQEKTYGVVPPQAQRPPQQQQLQQQQPQRAPQQRQPLQHQKSLPQISPQKQALQQPHVEFRPSRPAPQRQPQQVHELSQFDPQTFKNQPITGQKIISYHAKPTEKITNYEYVDYKPGEGYPKFVNDEEQQKSEVRRGVLARSTSYGGHQAQGGQRQSQQVPQGQSQHLSQGQRPQQAQAQVLGQQPGHHQQPQDYQQSPQLAQQYQSSRPTKDYTDQLYAADTAVPPSVPQQGLKQYEPHVQFTDEADDDYVDVQQGQQRQGLGVQRQGFDVQRQGNGSPVKQVQGSQVRRAQTSPTRQGQQVSPVRQVNGSHQSQGYGQGSGQSPVRRPPSVAAKSKAGLQHVATQSDGNQNQGQYQQPPQVSQQYHPEQQHGVQQRGQEQQLHHQQGRTPQQILSRTQVSQQRQQQYHPQMTRSVTLDNDTWNGYNGHNYPYDPNAHLNLETTKHQANIQQSQQQPPKPQQRPQLPLNTQHGIAGNKYYNEKQLSTSGYDNVDNEENEQERHSRYEAYLKQLIQNKLPVTHFVQSPDGTWVDQDTAQAMGINYNTNPRTRAAYSQSPVSWFDSTSNMISEQPRSFYDPPLAEEELPRQRRHFSQSPVKYRPGGGRNGGRSGFERAGGLQPYQQALTQSQGPHYRAGGHDKSVKFAEPTQLGAKNNVVHQQYNSPLNLYSAESAEEAYRQQLGQMKIGDPQQNRSNQPSYLTSPTRQYITEEESGLSHPYSGPQQSSSLKRLAHNVGRAL